MPSIIINDFSAGWTPGDDPIKGRRNGLLRMDNMDLDSNGALTLAGGAAVKQTGFPAAAHTLYSVLVNGARHDYSLLANGSGYRDATSLFASGGDTSNGAFSTAFNYTLIVSGDKRYKDNGSTLVNLGVTAPVSSPSLGGYGSCFTTGLPLDSHTVTPFGTSSYSSSQLHMDITTDFCIVQSYNISSIPFNWTILTGTPGTVDQSPNDYMSFTLFNFDILNDGFQIDILLNTPGSGGAQVANYYSYNTGSGLGSLEYFTGGARLTVRRSDFTRIGTTASLSWTTVYGYRLSFSTNRVLPQSLLVQADYAPDLKFTGGDVPFGIYDYAQMNVNNTGSYLAKSILSPTLVNINAEDLAVSNIIPVAPVDTQVNEVWIFRRNAATGGGDGQLNAWYRVKVVTTPYAAFYDTLSDEDALTVNIIFNTNMISIASTGVTDKIYDIIGPVNGRWYYFTTNFMYPSDINNPDLVNNAIALRITGSSSELFMWARQVSAETILVGTSLDVYAISGTYATFPDGTVDIFYRPLHCQYPPLTCDAVAWGGSVYYMANDGWRLISPGGENPSLVSPNLDRLYQGEDVSEYPHPHLKVIPRSVRFPLVIAKNKMWCFITGVNPPRVEVYDFVRQYWRPIQYATYSDFSAATATQDGQVLVFFGADKKLREIDISTSKLLDGSVKQVPSILTMVFDGGYPRQRKDSSTFKIRLSTTDSLNMVVTTESSGLVAVGPATLSFSVQDQAFDLSSLATLEIGKTYQANLGAGSFIGDLTIEDIDISYDLRPEQRTFIRVQSNNYGTTARKRISTIPFQLDSLGGNVIVTAYLDGVVRQANSYSANRKSSFNLEFAGGALLPIAEDYEFTLHSANLFEFFGFEEPRIVEVYPQQCISYTLPVSNFGNANKKRIRVRPFVISAPAQVAVTHVPLVDGSPTASTTWNVGIERKTYFHFFKTDVFGVDYGGYFTATGEFEVGDVLTPEVVQVLPIAKQFDQVGPEEFFRYGKIKIIELRVLSFGTPIPFTIYFNDDSNYTGSFDVAIGKECTRFITLPKGTSGNIVRIELGPTDFDFHRFYTRLQVTRSGKDTELEWINL